MEALEKFPTYSTMRKIADAFGGRKKFCSFPVIEWKEAFRGNQGKPDGIKVEDVTAPVMRGIEPAPAERPFVTLHTIGTRGENAYEGIEALHQRFTSDDPNTWISVGKSTPMHLVHSDIHGEEFDKLAQLARDEETSLNSDQYIGNFDHGSIHLADSVPAADSIPTADPVSTSDQTQNAI